MSSLHALVFLAVLLVACRAPEPAPAPPQPAAPSPASCPPDPPDRAEELLAAMRREDATHTHMVPDADTAFGPIVCKAKQGVWRDPTGQVRACTVARAVTVF